MSYDRKTIEDLIDGKLEWSKLKEIISNPKDPERFLIVLDVLQKRVGFSEKIILPLNEHLYVVKKVDKYTIKCDCGYDFCEYSENWKTRANIYVRDTEEKMQELYPPYMHAENGWMELREFYCPNCFSLLEVEAVPPGYPVIFDFLPDIEGFYKYILKRELP